MLRRTTGAARPAPSVKPKQTPSEAPCQTEVSGPDDGRPAQVPPLGAAADGVVTGDRGAVGAAADGVSSPGRRSCVITPTKPRTTTATIATAATGHAEERLIR